MKNTESRVERVDAAWQERLDKAREEMREEWKSDVQGLGTPVSVYTQLEQENKKKMGQVMNEYADVLGRVDNIKKRVDDACANSASAMADAKGASKSASETKGWIVKLIIAVVLLAVGKMIQDGKSQSENTQLLLSISNKMAVLVDHDAQYQKHLQETAGKKRPRD